MPADAVQHDEIAAGGTHLAGTGLASGPSGSLDVEALIADLDTVLTETEAAQLHAQAQAQLQAQAQASQAVPPSRGGPRADDV